MQGEREDDFGAVVNKVRSHDRAASVESWGVDAFSRRARQRISEVLAGTPPPGGYMASHVNCLLLGPTGSGKSSLIYTWWRALSSMEGSEATPAHKSLLKKLRVGWGVDNTYGQTEAPTRPSALAADAKHGTTTLDAFEIMPPGVTTTGGKVLGIAVQDTKGHQFFNASEERFAEHMLEGKLQFGSSEEKRNYRYWITVGHFGIGRISNLATAPHCLVLVFDVTLRSFERMLGGKSQSPLVWCYRSVLKRAKQQGHQVFAALTHVDLYEPDSGSDSDDDEVETQTESPTPSASSSNFNTTAIALSNSITTSKLAKFKRDRDMPDIIQRWKQQLSDVLVDKDQQGRRVLEPSCVFAVENYRAEKAQRDPSMDFAALDFLEKVVGAGQAYLYMKRSQTQGCILS